MRARVGARERQGEIQQEPERASESLREYVRARGNQREPEWEAQLSIWKACYKRG